MSSSISTLKQRLDILHSLNAIYADLDDLIVRAKPSTPEETAKLRELLASRDRVLEGIDRLLVRGFTDVAADLDRGATRLADYNKQLAAAKKSIDDVKLGLDIAGGVLEVVAAIVAVVV